MSLPATGPAPRLLRVLVVEDSLLTARAIARMIQNLGGQVLGPAPSVAKAMAILDSTPCDAALLDINLGNETVEPVATRLDESGKPFVFVSGYASPKAIMQNPRFKGKRLVAKPVEQAQLEQVIREEFPPHSPQPHSSPLPG